MSRFGIERADFRLFLVLWNQRMGMTTPAIHFRMGEWLEENWRRKNTQLLLMAFRASGKSTIVGLFAAWLLYRNSDLRLLVLAADSTLARKMVRQVKKIIERHPLTENMKPKDPDQWAASRFTVNRMTQLRDPSMLARGITSNITGSRADMVICDDIEVPKTCDTDEKRRALRERLMEIDYVLTPGGTQLYVGTPHTYNSIYADAPRAELGEEREFLGGFRRFFLPVLDEEGKSAWPEKYSVAILERIKLHTGPNKFASQMMLKPVNIAEGRLDPELLRFYSEELDYAPELRALFLNGKKLAGVSAWWDPSFGSEKGDRSVFAVVFADDTGNLFLHRLLYIKNPKRKTDDDEAAWQCRQIAGAARENFLPSLCVESNGIGKFLPKILRNELTREKSLCTVVEINNTRPKDIRILEAFDAVLASRRLFVHESIARTPFITEMREWRPGGRGHDDGLDAVAGAISRHSVRLPRLFDAGGAHLWTSGTKIHRAETDFEV